MDDCNVFGLTRARREYRSPIGSAGCLNRLHGLGDRSCLIWLHENCIAGSSQRSFADAGGIGYQEIITDDLDAISDSSSETNQSVLIELRQRILDRYDGVSIEPIDKHRGHVIGIQRPAVQG